MDPLQRVSSVPLPKFQTGEADTNPVPLNAPKEMARVEKELGARDAARFEDYLNSSSIVTVERETPQPTSFDTAADIESNSVYAQSLGKAPV